MNKPTITLVLAVVLFLSACTSGQNATTTAPATGGQQVAAITITATAFAANANIPQEYTCQGSDISPELEWRGVPQGTKSLALIVDDPDAPGGVWTHWVVYNISPDTKRLVEDATKKGLPQGAIQGVTSFKKNSYGGPCPPSGTHHYHFKIYALDTAITTPNLDSAGLVKAMDGHVLAQGEMVGLYAKK